MAHEKESERDPDLDVLRPTSRVRRATFLVGLAGVLSLLSGVQSLGLLFRIALLKPAPYLMIVSGVVSIYLCAQVGRLRHGATLAAAGLAGLSAVGMLGWLYVAFSLGFLSFMQVIAAPTMLLAAIFALWAAPDAKKAAQARRRMQVQGLDMGM